jgi:hypothetical protein
LGNISLVHWHRRSQGFGDVALCAIATGILRLSARSARPHCRNYRRITLAEKQLPELVILLNADRNALGYGA